MPISPAKTAAKTKISATSDDRSTPAAAASAEESNSNWRAGARQRIRPETRAEMLERLTNPQISLHEASVILRVCGATVRHYSDAGYLPHSRTSGGQRRFYLKEVLAFLREREAEKRKKKF